MDEMNCENCVHKRICDLWSEAEGQTASCYVDDCFQSAADVAHSNEWVSVNDRMPDDQQSVIVYAESRMMKKHVTHWMPMPKPPKEKR